MTDFTSEFFLADREEKYLLTLVFRSTIYRNDSAGDCYVWPKRRIIKMEVSNLSSLSLTRAQIKSLAACLPSLQCGPTTNYEHFEQMWHQEIFDVCQFSSTSQMNTFPPSEVAARSERRRHHQQDNSHLLLMTPIHPKQINIQALANTQNHFSIMEFEGRRFVRVTSPVHSPDGRQCQRKWRVSDYSLDGQVVLSVISSMTMDRRTYNYEESWQSEQQQNRITF